jgi:hypothetical protein
MGHHYHDEGIKLLNGIISQMNNNRLSTCKSNSSINREELIKEINLLLLGPSNIEIREGREFIKSLNRFKGVKLSNSLELFDEEGNLFKSFSSISNCAEFLQVSRSKVYSIIEGGKAFDFSGKVYYIKKKS